MKYKTNKHQDRTTTPSTQHTATKADKKYKIYHFPPPPRPSDHRGPHSSYSSHLSLPTPFLTIKKTATAAYPVCTLPYCNLTLTETQIPFRTSQNVSGVCKFIYYNPQRHIAALTREMYSADHFTFPGPLVTGNAAKLPHPGDKMLHRQQRSRVNIADMNAYLPPPPPRAG